MHGWVWQVTFRGHEKTIREEGEQVSEFAS
jgi:hypothetical protein